MRQSRPSINVLSRLDPKGEARCAARLAIVALYFGNSQRAVELCELGADPTPKRVFEETLAVWHGDLGELTQTVERAGNGPLRASVALGVGRTSSQGLTEPERSVVVEILTRGLQNRPTRRLMGRPTGASAMGGRTAKTGDQ